MIQMNLVDGLMEPVASFVCQDHMIKGLKDHMIGIIAQYRNNDLDISAELIYSYKGVHSRNYFSRHDMTIIHEIFDETLEVLQDEVRKVWRDKSGN